MEGKGSGVPCRVTMDVPLMGCPLAVFQGGQFFLPSSECVVSTGDSQEHLASLAAPWGHPQSIPTLYNQTHRSL